MAQRDASAGRLPLRQARSQELLRRAGREAERSQGGYSGAGIIGVVATGVSR